MKKLLVGLMLIIGFLSLNAQNKYFTKAAVISFDATAKSSPETIAGKSTTGTSVIDATTGKMEFAVLVKSINFKKALMQEHFNENYVESSKFPKALFKGKIENIKDINFQKDGTYKANISGELTMHGVTKPIKTFSTIKVSGGKIMANSSITVSMDDYGIEVPSLVSDKVGKSASINIEANYEALKK